MVNLNIIVKGKAIAYDDYTKRRIASNYANGEGLYALVDTDETVFGLVSVLNKHLESHNGKDIEVYDTQEMIFPPKAIADIAVEDSVKNLSENLEAKIDNSFGEVSDVINKFKNDLADCLSEINSTITNIANNGNGKGITEKTLLAALSIVTKTGTNNGEIV